MSNQTRIPDEAKDLREKRFLFWGKASNLVTQLSDLINLHSETIEGDSMDKLEEKLVSIHIVLEDFFKELGLTLHDKTGMLEKLKFDFLLIGKYEEEMMREQFEEQYKEGT